MATPFLAEIKIFGGNFAPRGYAFCSGQIISIAQNTALFSLLGTTFGGNGTVNFALPNLQGSAPLGQCGGQGPGLSPYALGQTGGTPTVTVLQTQLPQHTHTAACFSTNPNPAPLPSPAGNVWAVASARRVVTSLYAATSDSTMNPTALPLMGGSQPHNNLQPFLAIHFIIATEGIFPSRN
jgi:microcystin-dependent protein